MHTSTRLRKCFMQFKDDLFDEILNMIAFLTSDEQNPVVGHSIRCWVGLKRCPMPNFNLYLNALEKQ